MREVNRSYSVSDIPDKLKEQYTFDQLELISSTGNKSLISDRIYRDPYFAGSEEGNQSRIIDKLNIWYYGKCAYCERYYKLDVEHYRPKGEIRDLDNSLISNSGYYWLCYEWSNLIPSCITCNREGGKNSKFPYINGGVRQSAPLFDANGTLNKSSCNIKSQNLLNERPALLHPETDQNFLNYFSFKVDSDLNGITIQGIDPIQRGQATIEICKLNREETRRSRLQSVVKPFSNSIKATIKKLESGTINQNEFATSVNVQIQKLYDDQNEPDLDFVLLRKFIISDSVHFENIVIPFIVDNFKQIMLNAFKNYTPL